uniref:GH16 domain-containing protein n=1 Tax=Lotharella globosa TaxID=91324 RepID=A0A7S3YYK4_9EUKA|eukprot:CAMPEP_0167790780 /NCGR_PEP_ID=MMETSP0111_2-20121227/11537_1 /TAXON_ID=91324 /ORGANISM="Lotharella globosa, Strain CCCM811" /LENGTH=349 /DNA_ID=CAMNT_0007683309 /DNA_START=23 /DNA_END=1072 /DNA_ORIENTATION=-
MAGDPSREVVNPDVKEDEGYELVWSDEFKVDGRPDPTKWNFEKGFVRNNELQWYQPHNAYCKGGQLVIEARRETDMKNPNFKGSQASNWKQKRAKIAYTSACITTRGRKAWKYGRFEIKAKIQNKAGLWPAIWFLGIKGQWPSNGEIDLMECYKGKILANVAWGTKEKRKAKWNSKKKRIGPGWDENYHVWRMDWDEHSIRLYVDGKQLNHTDLSQTNNGTQEFNGPRNPFHQPHYLLINLAIGGNCGGDPTHTPFPSHYVIDYVRVYQKKNRNKHKNNHKNNHKKKKNKINNHSQSQEKSPKNNQKKKRKAAGTPAPACAPPRPESDPLPNASESISGVSSEKPPETR